MIVISATSACTVCPHLEQTKPFLVARMYEPHFSQNFMLSLQGALGNEEESRFSIQIHV